MKKTILLAIVLLFFTACSNTAPAITGEWKLVSYGEAGNPTSAIPNVDTTINFDSKGQMSGNVGCNGFGGTYELKGDKMTFSGIISTMMYCDAISAQEQGVLSVFADNVELKIQMSGDTLTITSADGSSVVNLARK
jgi:heat shock protein HslJ